MLAIQQNLSKRFYALLSLPSTAMGFALSVQISALSWILTTQYGLDIHEVGLVWAAGPIAGILGQVIIGIISDKVWFWNGRRRPFILIGGVLAGLMLLALPNIDIISTAMGVEAILAVAIAIALTLDLSINVGFNPTRSIIADVTPEGEKRTRGYTWMQTISGTFGVLAYAIGAIWGNFVLIYFGAALVLVLSIFPPLFITEPKELQQSENQVTSTPLSFADIMINIKPLWGFIIYDIYAMGRQLSGATVDNYYVEIICAILTVKFVMQTMIAKEDDKTEHEAGLVGFRKILAAHSFSWIGIQTMFVFIFAFLQDKMTGISDADLGQIISISFLILSAVAAILPALLLQPLAKKIGRVKVHTYCIASMAVGYFAIAYLGHSQYTLYFLMAILGIGWSAVISLVFAIMSEKIDQSKMGMYMGLFNLSVVIPQLLVSLGIGLFISQTQDKSMIFILCGITLAISALCWSQVKEHKK
ncbi:MFS transporter [Thalassomonas sp. M1454]|uniref:MFS transporter n=1 Tax=Thalassomonas sp. M1454 TaxID=2594477 RepID=UPI00117D1B9B|nr:MFS transporter [Thalassomonas sp. M1454]TRX58069.1 SLC45 family MFS transporter [Thalassomonas sp. M1454]